MSSHIHQDHLQLSSPRDAYYLDVNIGEPIRTQNIKVFIQNSHLFINFCAFFGKPTNVFLCFPTSTENFACAFKILFIVSFWLKRGGKQRKNLQRKEKFFSSLLLRSLELLACWLKGCDNVLHTQNDSLLPHNWFL